jgi:predicted TIM-barrel fold metal-dependent hydrolase
VDHRTTPKINLHGHIRHDQDLRARVRAWEEWNVVRFCCLCLPEGLAPDYYGNADFVRIRDEYRALIVGFAGVGLRAGSVDGAADVRRYREQGFAGLKCIGNSYPYGDERYFPIYEQAEALGMPAFFHTGWLMDVGDEVSRRFHLAADHMRPYTLDPIARAFPKLPIVGAHLGLPHPAEALTLLERFPNLYYDITGGSGRAPHVRQILAALLPPTGLETDMADPEQNRALGWFGKLVFGTDNPEPALWAPQSQAIMERLAIPAATRARFYYGNAAAILGLA